MRRALLLALALLAGFPASAWAPDHVMKVMEVMTSNGGDASVQFVELLDPNAEPFPNAPYRVVVYDAAGTRLGGTDITPFHTSPMLIGTAAADAALGTTRDATLATPLPTTAGQVCFTNTIGGVETRIHCLTYGCITTFVSGVRASGAAPPDGQSAQRQDDGTVALGAPTPRAANITGAATTGCPGGSTPPPPPGPPPPAGPPPPPGPPPPGLPAPLDTTKPRITALRVNPSSFCVKRSRICRTPGTRVRFRLSERADVTMEVFYLGATASKRRVKTIRLRGRRAGTHVIRYSGTGLKRGRYVLNVFAQDAARNVSRSVSARFSVRR